MKRKVKSLTVRVPVEMAEQIEARAALHHRSMSAECELLLEHALDTILSRDLELLTKMRQRET